MDRTRHGFVNNRNARPFIHHQQQQQQHHNHHQQQHHNQQQQQHHQQQQRHQQHLQHQSASSLYPISPPHHHIQSLQHRLAAAAAAASPLDELPPSQYPESNSRFLQAFPPSRAASGAPVPTEHWDRDAILAYRHRVNASSLNPIPRGQNLDWDLSPQQQQHQRRQISLTGLRALGGSSLRSESGYSGLDEIARYRESLFVRDFNRQSLSRDTREDLRRSEHLPSLALTELAESRRSAELSAKVFLEEGHTGGDLVNRSGVYNVQGSPIRSLTDQTRSQGFPPEREEVYRESRLVRIAPRVVERGSPLSRQQHLLGYRKRGREDDLDIDREKMLRQRRLADNAFEVSLGTTNQSLHLNRMADQPGDEHFIRKLVPEKHHQEEDRDDVQVTSPYVSLAAGPRSDSFVSSISAIVKGKPRRHPGQQIGRGRLLPPERVDRRPGSPYGESRHSFLEKYEETAVPISKKLGGHAALNIDNRHWEAQVKDKAVVLKQEHSHSPAFLQENSSKREVGLRMDQRLDRHGHSEVANEHAKMKNVVGNTHKAARTRNRGKGQQASLTKRQRVALGQKQGGFLQVTTKSSRGKEPVPCRSLKSQVIRVVKDNESESSVIRKPPKLKSGEVEHDKESSFASKIDRAAGSTVHDLLDIQPSGEDSRMDHLSQQNPCSEHLYTQSGSGGKQKISTLSVEQFNVNTQSLLQGESSFYPDNQWSESQLQKPIAPKKPEPLPESMLEVQCNGEGEDTCNKGAELQMSSYNPKLLLQGHQSFTVSEPSLRPTYQNFPPLLNSASSVPNVPSKQVCTFSSERIPFSIKACSPEAVPGISLEQVQSLFSEAEKTRIAPYSCVKNSLSPGRQGNDEVTLHDLHAKSGTVIADVSQRKDPVQGTIGRNISVPLDPRVPLQSEGLGKSPKLAGVVVTKLCAEHPMDLEVSNIVEKVGDFLYKDKGKLKEAALGTEARVSLSHEMSVQNDNGDVLQQATFQSDRGSSSSAGIDTRQSSEEAAPIVLNEPTFIPHLKTEQISKSESLKISLPSKKTSLTIGSTKGQPDPMAEREVRLFGKTLKASVSEPGQQPEEVLRTDEIDAKVEKTNTPSFLTKQDTKLEEQNSLPQSVSGIVLPTSSPLVSPPGQNLEDSGVEAVEPGNDKKVGVYAAVEVNEKVGLPKIHIQRSVQQFRRGISTSVASNPSKLFTAPSHQHRGGVVQAHARSGAHTWRRTTPASTSRMLVPFPRITKASDTVRHDVTKPLISQATSYVRKGNSLVRAAAPTKLPAALNSGAAQVISKEIAGNSQRRFPLSSNQTKYMGGTSRRVLSTEKLPAKEAGRRPFLAQKPDIPLNVPDNNKMQAGMGTAPLNLQAVRPQTPEPEENLIPLVRNAVTGGEHESTKQQGGNPIASVSIESLVNDGTGQEQLSLEMAGSMPHSSVLAKTILPASRANSASADWSEARLPIYVKSKANQLVAATPFNPQGLSRTDSQNCLTFSGHTSQDFYVKRKKNQLVRNGADVASAAFRLLQGAYGSGSIPRTIKARTEAILQTKLGRVLRQKCAGRSSWVWTLNGTKHGAVDATTAQSNSVVPLLFPWKRPALGMSVRAGRFKALPKAKKGSLLFLICKKLQNLHKVQPVYTRSAHGFSLHRSGLLSLGGANLKWTKSIEKRSKQASEEATRAVAAVEKKRREEKEAVVEAATAVAKAKADRRAARKAARGERIVLVGLVRYKMDATGRTLQRLPDQSFSNSTDASAATKVIDTTKLPTPRRLSIGGTKYVRVGNGNQLMRDPKAASRALASEKVRWSLHTARFRRAKKQQYCQFFTRFGKCNKTEGKCPYIHDPQKVAVCTKFLKGTCSGSSCLLTHEVIPERMPDCSYFLKGLCTNENCPYRHVNVNPKAPICEGFLKGYCADGDECNKKHTYVCPVYASTGECLEQLTCKLHHPKKREKSGVPMNARKNAMGCRRRYFVTGTSGLDERLSVGVSNLNHEDIEDSEPVANDSMEFISISSSGDIDIDEEEGFSRGFALLRPQLAFLQQEITADDTDKWIKPALLLQRQVDAVPANC